MHVLAELGKLYMRIGGYSDAERCFRRYVAVHPECAEVHADIAHSCLMQKRFARAIKDADRALRYDRNCWLAHTIKGDAHARLGRWEEAIAALKQSLWLSDIDVDDACVHNTLARSYEHAGEHELGRNIQCRTRKVDVKACIRTEYSQLIDGLVGASCDKLRWTVGS